MMIRAAPEEACSRKILSLQRLVGRPRLTTITASRSGHSYPAYVVYVGRGVAIKQVNNSPMNSTNASPSNSRAAIAPLSGPIFPVYWVHETREHFTECERTRSLDVQRHQPTGTTRSPTLD